MIVSDAENEALAAQLAERLGTANIWLTVSDATPQALLNTALGERQDAPAALNVIDLRGLKGCTTAAQTQRCYMAQQWSLALEASGLESQGSRVTLWLPTQAASTGDDAALWGFGRSLANEAVGHSVTLIDLPNAPSDAALNAFAASLATPDSENELVITVEGERFATRLRTLPAPHPSSRQALRLIRQ